MPPTHASRPDGGGGPDQRRGRLVVVSNRVADLSAADQAGGLAVAVGEALLGSGGLWFGWSGAIKSDAESAPPQTRDFRNVRSITVGLTPEEHEGFYLGFANQCLWPLFHYRLDLADQRAGLREAYFAVNKRFAAALSPFLEAGDTLWVHDYQLIPFAGFLRQLGVDDPIGFFLHIPFPSPEIFAALPEHKSLARAFFAYDLVGFQTVRDRENFARYAEAHLDARRADDGRLRAFGRTLSIEAFPIGIDAAAFADEAAANVRGAEVRSFARGAEGQHLIVGVDRLDYSKGLPERVRGVAELLDASPSYRGRLQFLQVAPPTRDGVGAYDDIRRELEQLTSQVNGTFGDLGWTPIRYIHRSLPRPVLAGLYRRCRVGLVTPLRDGMNLVAKEYVAAQDPADPGVLVLSEFAGATEQLEDALIVNPYDPGSLAAAIRRAVEMPLGERQGRHRALWRNVADENVSWWREKFLKALDMASASQRTAGVLHIRTSVPETLINGKNPERAKR